MPPAVALNAAQTWLRDLTYQQLSEWYEYWAKRMTGDLEIYAETFEIEAKIIRDSKPPHERPYQNPYYWAGFVLTGELQ